MGTREVSGRQDGSLGQYLFATLKGTFRDQPKSLALNLAHIKVNALFSCFATPKMVRLPIHSATGWTAIDTGTMRAGRHIGSNSNRGRIRIIRTARIVIIQRNGLQWGFDIVGIPERRINSFFRAKDGIAPRTHERAVGS